MSFKVAGIGEVLWDMLPRDQRQMGGAPANFAVQACALGAEARVVSRVGNDDLGRELIARLEALGVATDSIEVDATAPTGTVDVAVAPDGQPRFVIHEEVAWDRLAGAAAGQRAMTEADAVCFGTLGQRSDVARGSIRALLQLVPEASLRILDVNLRQHFYTRALIEESLSMASVLKVSDTELPLLAEMFQLPADERKQITELTRRFHLRVVAYTRGARGSLLHSEGCWSEHPGVPVRVVDTVGAGDSFTAALALGLLAGWPLDTVNDRASAVAAYVCSQSGATPPLPESLRAPFLALQSPKAAGHGFDCRS